MRNINAWVGVFWEDNATCMWGWGWVFLLSWEKGATCVRVEGFWVDGATGVCGWGRVFVLLGERAQQKCVGRGVLEGWCNTCGVVWGWV